VVVGPEATDAGGRSDLVVAGYPGGVDPLAVEAERRGLERLRQFGEGDLRVTVYAESRAAPR
jgi:hypothetical protein